MGTTANTLSLSKLKDLEDKVKGFLEVADNCQKNINNIQNEYLEIIFDKCEPEKKQKAKFEGLANNTSKQMDEILKEFGMRLFKPKEFSYLLGHTLHEAKEILLINGHDYFFCDNLLLTCKNGKLFYLFNSTAKDYPLIQGEFTNPFPEIEANWEVTLAQFGNGENAPHGEFSVNENGWYLQKLKLLLEDSYLLASRELEDLGDIAPDGWSYEESDFKLWES